MARFLSEAFILNGFNPRPVNCHLSLVRMRRTEFLKEDPEPDVEALHVRLMGGSKLTFSAADDLNDLSAVFLPVA